MSDVLTVGGLIAALSAFPSDARIIVEDTVRMDGAVTELYTNAGQPEVRYLHAPDRDCQTDLTPTILPGNDAEVVVLLAPVASERARYDAPEGTSGVVIYRPFP